MWLPGFIEGQLGSSPKRTAEWTVATVRSINRLPQTRLVDAYRTCYGLPMDVPATVRRTAKKQGVTEGALVGVSVGATVRVKEGSSSPIRIGVEPDGGAGGFSTAAAAESTAAATGATLNLQPATGSADGGRHD